MRSRDGTLDCKEAINRRAIVTKCSVTVMQMNGEYSSTDVAYCQRNSQHVLPTGRAADSLARRSRCRHGSLSLCELHFEGMHLCGDDALLIYQLLCM